MLDDSACFKITREKFHIPENIPISHWFRYPSPSETATLLTSKGGQCQVLLCWVRSVLDSMTLCPTWPTSSPSMTRWPVNSWWRFLYELFLFSRVGTVHFEASFNSFGTIGRITIFLNTKFPNHCSSLALMFFASDSTVTRPKRS